MILFMLMLLLFGITIFLFVLFIIKRDHGRKEPLPALYAALGFGLLSLFIAGILNELLIPQEVIDSIGIGAGGISNTKLFASVMLIGLIEESAKCVPIAFFMYKKKYFDELTDGIIYFGIVALTFGIIEDFVYAKNFGVGVGISRIILSPYLHAGFTMLFGICLSYKKVLNKSWLLVFIGYIAAISAHGIYNFFAFKGGIAGFFVILQITLMLNVLLFVLFRKAQKIDESRGLSTVGINKYCRSCGKPNPKRFLHCSYCGRLS
jgi:protease PrsW